MLHLAAFENRSFLAGVVLGGGLVPRGEGSVVGSFHIRFRGLRGDWHGKTMAKPVPILEPTDLLASGHAAV